MNHPLHPAGITATKEKAPSGKTEDSKKNPDFTKPESKKPRVWVCWLKELTVVSFALFVMGYLTALLKGWLL